MKQNQVERNFRGQIKNLDYVRPVQTRTAQSLNEMATAARNYLENNPDPSRDYECKFQLWPLGIPCHNTSALEPNEYGYDPISLADTDCRMDWQYIYMRRMCGVKEKTPAEIGVRKRILSYLNEEYLCMLAIYGFDMANNMRSLSIVFDETRHPCGEHRADSRIGY